MAANYLAITTGVIIQWWLLVSGTLGNLKLIEISIQTPNILFEENSCENIDCIISAILFSLHCGKVHPLLLRKIHTPVGITMCDN